MRVLVLCHGSKNRSPYVAGLIRQQRPDWQVVVAGLKSVPGTRATPKTRRAAEALGFSLETHRSQQVTLDMVREATIVLYMDGGNERRLRALTDQAPTKRDRAMLWHRCQLLATYGCLRRVPDPNYTSDPVKLAEMFGVAHYCTRKFLEAHP